MRMRSKSFLKTLSLYVFYSFFIVLFSCKNKMTSSLLTDYIPCSSSDSICQNAQSTTEPIGEFSITPDFPILLSSIEDSDLIEVTGTCNDLGRKSHKILIKLYEGAAGSTIPILDNTISDKCQDHVSTTLLKPDSSGTAQTCLFVTTGYGVIDSSTGSVYPQCFNGRFSFSVRLGRQLRQDMSVGASFDTSVNAVDNYLLRLQLRSLENVVSESSISSVILNRTLLKPNYTVTPNFTDSRMEFNLKPSQFMDIRYSAEFEMVGPSNGQTGAFTNSASSTLFTNIPVLFPLNSSGNSLENYYHNQLSVLHGINAGGLLPGMTYKYRFKSTDFMHGVDYIAQFGAGNYEDSGWTTDLNYNFPPPTIISSTPFSDVNGCEFKTSGMNMQSVSGTRIFKTEWAYSSSLNWTTDDPNGDLGGVTFLRPSGFAVSSTLNCASSSCYVCKSSSYNCTHSSLSGVTGTLFFATRQYLDTNNNNVWDPGEYVGLWSTNTFNGTNGSVVNACQFR